MESIFLKCFSIQEPKLTSPRRILTPDKKFSIKRKYSKILKNIETSET